MIVQSFDGGLLFFRQTDHALLSGAYATAWVDSFAHRASVLVAASRHDDGWGEWEMSPKLRADGTPVDFIRVALSDHVELYKRGIDLTEAEDPYAGLVVSLHGQRLYTRPFHPGMDARITHLQGDDLELAQGYVDGEAARQSRLLRSLGASVRDDAHEAWRLLQVWDRLSLLVCMSALGSGNEQTMPPIRWNGDDARIVARLAPGNEMTLDPYPFAEVGAEFNIAYTRTEKTTWESEEEYRRDFRNGDHETLRFRCVPA